MVTSSRFSGGAIDWWKKTRKAFVQRFRNLKQGSQSVEAYATKFFDMMSDNIKNDVHESEQQLTSQFISGLRPQLQTNVKQFNPSTVQEARDRAILIEQQLDLLWLPYHAISTCSVDGKVIRILFESRNVHNFSERVVRKLRLQSVSLADPPTIRFLNDTTEIRISKQVLVKLMRDHLGEKKKKKWPKVLVIYTPPVPICCEIMFKKLM